MAPTLQLEKARVQQCRPNVAKIINIYFFNLRKLLGMYTKDLKAVSNQYTHVRSNIIHDGEEMLATQVSLGG